MMFAEPYHCCWLRCTNRAGGDARVQMLKPLSQAPKGFTGVTAHKLKQISGTAATLPVQWIEFVIQYGSGDVLSAGRLYVACQLIVKLASSMRAEIAC